jgi:hypothetical protein
MTHSRAVEYLTLAESYAEAARRLSPHAGTINLPFNMLVAHALELSIKAVLGHQGEGEERLMMRGHNLAVCLSRAQQRGFNGLSGTGVQALVGALDAPHAMQTFRYPSPLFASPCLDPRGVCGTLADHLQDVRLYLQEAVS